MTAQEQTVEETVKPQPLLKFEEKPSKRKLLKLHTVSSQADILKSLAEQAGSSFSNEVLTLFEDRLPERFQIEKIEADFIAGIVKVYGKETAAKED